MSVYDESGVPVAMHPIQATSKTDQPERINLPYGMYWQERNPRNHAGSLYNSDGATLVMQVFRFEAELVAAAMGSNTNGR